MARETLETGHGFITVLTCLMATSFSHYENQLGASMIFSIGHGNRDFNDFVKLLHEYEVEYLIDVRSSLIFKNVSRI